MIRERERALLRIEVDSSSFECVLYLGCEHVLGRSELERAKSGCVLCNMGSSCEIDVAYLRARDLSWHRVHANGDLIDWPDR